jgi:hypothetical protein
LEKWVANRASWLPEKTTIEKEVINEASWLPERAKNGKRGRQ